MNQNSGEKKSFSIIRVIGLFLIFNLVFLFISFITSYRTMQWEKITPDNHAHYAELCKIPAIAEQIESVYERGMRDTEYCIETASFDSLSALYAILPFDHDAERAAALEAVGETADTIPALPQKDAIREIYIAKNLPLSDDADDCFHEYYVIRTDSGFRFVFIVQTT